MTDSSFTFLRVRGIAIGAHWSWLFVFALVVWSLAESLFPSTYPGLGDGAYLLMGAVAGGLFFLSILLHELGHAFRALREGMVIDGITLWLFGGVARFKGMFPSAGAEFRIAIAGPLVSIAIALFFGLLTAIGLRVDWPAGLQGIVDYLWRINAIVVAFNLVPALPLDGGRILRALLWHRQRSFTAATRSAAAAGKAFGGLLAAVGLLNFFSGGGGASGLWFVFLGWFLIQAAQSEVAIGLMHRALRGCRVRDLMTPDPSVVDAGMSVERFLDEVAESQRHSTYPVVRAGEMVGLISLQAAGRVPADRRSTTEVSEAMTPRSEIGVLDPDAEVIDVLDPLQQPPRRAPVMDDGTLVGFLSLSDVSRMLELEEVRDRSETTRPRRSGLLIWAVVGVVMIGAAGYFYHPPYIVIEPGTTLDVAPEITISGVPVDRIEGGYLLTTVSLSRPSAWGLLWGAIRDREVVSSSQLIPEGVDREDYFRGQREVFRESRVLAAAAAARATGLDVSVSGTGVVVEQILPGSPAAAELEEGDVIVAINGSDVNLTTDLQETIRARSAGTRFNLTVERGGAREEVALRSARLTGAAEGAVGIGVIISTRGFDIDLPFKIEFESHDIGGPSAGLLYALVIADMLEPGDALRGRTVAATGTIDIEGDVGAVGSVDLKAEAAAEGGASLFLVPERDLDDVDEEGLRTIGVSSLRRALELLTATS